MRIVSRKEFLKLPPGTVYCECPEPWAWGDIQIKWDSLIYSADGDGDWICTTLVDIYSDDSGQLVEKWEGMMESAESYPLDLDVCSRDGCFHREAVYLIYEHADVVNLRDLFTRLAEATG